MKRRGFTLIELMVVIAIIIILAAIAIPNYLSMTARAKRSRVASDFAAIATSLETYRTDWNEYPIFGSAQIINMTGSTATLHSAGVGEELSGVSTAGVKMTTGVNATGTTAAGEKGPIQYMTPNILKSMINPYSSDDGDQYVYYGTGPTTAAPTAPIHWLLIAHQIKGGGLINTANADLWRSDETTGLTNDTTATPATIPLD